MTPALDAGINLIDNCNLGADDLGEPANADELLDRHAQGAEVTRADVVVNRTVVDADTALAAAERGRVVVDGERDDIHEQLEHHHERRHAPRGPGVPRGSAELPRLRKAFAKAAHEAEVAGATPHTCRHTFASILIHQGASVEFVSDQLGHASTKTTWDIYVHLFRARDQAAAAKRELDAAFGHMLRAVGEEPPDE